MSILCYILSALCGYLFGSVSVSVIVSKLFYKSDVRKQGSGNAGATNMARVYGIIGGIIVLIGDFLKAVAAISVAKYLIPTISEEAGTDICVMFAGAFCVVGHAFPLFFRFKGGKGVTVGAAVALMADYRALLVILAVFVIVVAISKIVSLSSILAAAALPVISGVLLGFGEISVWLFAMCCFASVVVISLHHKNIVRLFRGEEKKFRPKRRGE